MPKKGAVFKWTKECKAAFKLLKEKLMEEPVLISPQVNKDYVIHRYTDELVPVAYFLGNFNKTQVKWNITEKETYVIYKSAK